MKKLILLLLILLLTLPFSFAQQDYSTKVQTLDSTIETLYAVISGEKGVERNWELFKYLFIEEGRLMPTSPNEEGKMSYQQMTPEQYIERADSWLVENGFFEKEICRVTESYGPVTHIFSTYESYYSESDEEPFARGINSMQLLKDEDRWWVVSIYWSGETDENPIPKKYLPKK